MLSNLVSPRNLVAFILTVAVGLLTVAVGLTMLYGFKLVGLSAELIMPNLGNLFLIAIIYSAISILFVLALSRLTLSHKKDDQAEVSETKES